MSEVDKLAQDIRQVDGNHSLGAGALAEKLIERGWCNPEMALIISDEDNPELINRFKAAQNMRPIVPSMLVVDEPDPIEAELKAILSGNDRFNLAMTEGGNWILKENIRGCEPQTLAKGATLRECIEAYKAKQ